MCSNHELQATLNALGYLEDGEYYKSRDCLNAAKDLVRFLRRDDPNEKSIRRELLKSDVITNDLIPLLKILKSKKDAELFDIVLRLLVNLTQSALNCFELKIPDDKLQYNTFIEIDNYLKNVKESFANEEFIKVLCDKLNELISKNWEDRPEEEDMIVERILFLVRNILLIKPPDEDLTNRLATDLNSHDLLILTFHKTNLLETLINMTASNNHVKYAINLLEIITLMLREQSCEELANVSENEFNMASKRSQLEKERDFDELEQLSMRDSQMRKHNRMKLNPRHSRFMGTYTAMNMKSINDENKLIVHKHARNMSDLLDDSSKKVIKKAKNKIILENDTQHKSVLFIRIILKKFCTSILKNSYNTFLRNLKDLIQRKKLEDDEICYYYWLIQFLTEFNRNSEFDEQTKMEMIKETFCMEIFHSVQVFIDRCKEMMVTDKKQNRLWARRMHTALKCYKENLITLYALEKKMSDAEKSHNERNKLNNIDLNIDMEDNDRLVDLAEQNYLGSSPLKTNNINPTETELAKPILDEKMTNLIEKLKSQIFYIQEFREIFITIMKDYDQGKMTKSFLKDIIEANHIFVLMLEVHSKKNGSISVSSKKKARKKTNKSKKDGKKSKKAKETKEEKEQRLKEEKEYEKRLEEQENDFKEKVWQKSFSKIASLFQNDSEIRPQEDNLMPFDFVATSDQEFDSQKDKVVEKIQHLLSIDRPDDSIALFREARCLWPQDRELFGGPQMQADEEFETFKNLFMKQLDIKKPELTIKSTPENNENKPDEGIEDDFNDQDADGEEEKDERTNEDKEYYEDIVDNEENNDGEKEDETETGGYVVEEENLEVEKFIFRYSHPCILKCYILMFSQYAKNTDFLNRCCMNYFERIAIDCGAPQCLYQLGLFDLINKIYKDPLSRCMMNIMDNKRYKAIDNIYDSKYSSEDMFAFFRQLIAKFFEQATKNKVLYLEVLFFKDKKIIEELSEGSGGYEAMDARKNNGKHRKIAWTQEEQDELKELFEKFKVKYEKYHRNNENNEEEEEQEEQDESSNDNIKLNGDIVDMIMLHIKDGSRQRRDISVQLANLGCVNSIDELKEEKFRTGASKLGRNKLWRQEDLEDLRQTFELIKSEAKQTDKPLNEMMNKLQACISVKRNKSQIADKLIELGLITNRNEIIGSSKKNRLNSKYNKSDDDDIIDDDTDSEVERKSKKDKKKKKKKNKKNKNKDEETSNDKKSENDIFDAGSSSSSSSSGSSSSSSSSSSSGSSSDEKESSSSQSSSSESEKEDDNIPLGKMKISNEDVLNKINELDDVSESSSSSSSSSDLDSENEEKSSPTKIKKKKQKLILSEDEDEVEPKSNKPNINEKDESSNDNLIHDNNDSEKEEEPVSKKSKSKTKKEKTKKIRKQELYLSEEDDDDENAADNKKERKSKNKNESSSIKKRKSTTKKLTITDESSNDSNKNNSVEQEETAEVAISNSKKRKKQSSTTKKRVKVFDESSNSSNSNGPNNISSSNDKSMVDEDSVENDNIKENKKQIISDNDNDSDEDMSPNSKSTSSKKQRLILSSDDE